MEIAAITLIVIGLAAAVSTLYFSASLRVPRCALCSEELETDVNDDWLWMYGEGYVGWLSQHVRCPRCDTSATYPQTPEKDKSASASLA
jgi:hypothetical protein